MAKIAVIGLRGIPATWGGVEHHCEELYSRLAARGHDVTIYARTPYVERNIARYKGMSIVRIPTVSKAGLEAFVHTFLSLFHILKTKPQIVHFCCQGPCLLSWIPRLFRPRTRIFFTCHGLDWQRKKWSPLASAIIHLGEVFSSIFPHYRITVSKELQRYYKDTYGVSAYYIPSGVKKMERRDPDFIKQFGLEGKDYLLFVGRLVPEKRIEDIIRAYCRKEHKFRLVIVGDSAVGTEQYGEFVKTLAKKRNPVLFAGYQFGSNLEEFYSNARAFVTASELEGLPLTLLEALSFGLPCIVSDIPPHKEILEYQPELVFSTGSVDALSDLMDLVDDMPNDALTDLGRRAATILDRDFDWNNISTAIEQLYKESIHE